MFIFYRKMSVTKSLVEGEERLRICLVSDFFYPNMGGVESHLFQVRLFFFEKFMCQIRVFQSFPNLFSFSYSLPSA